MKKIFLVLFFVFSSFSAYGASSDDVYVRKDMFEMRMDRLEKTMEKVVNELNELNKNVAVLSERINGVEAKLSKQIEEVDARLSKQIEEVDKRLSKQIEEVDKRLSSRIDNVESKLSKQIEEVDIRLSSRIDSVSGSLADLRNNIYLWLIIIGLIFGIPAVQKLFQWREEKKEKKEKTAQVLTAEDVKKMINEAFLAHNLSVQGK